MKVNLPFDLLSGIPKTYPLLVHDFIHFKTCKLCLWWFEEKEKLYLFFKRKLYHQAASSCNKMPNYKY